MSDLRATLAVMLIPAFAALAVLAAVVFPNGDQLGWGRLSAGLGAYLVVQIGGGWVLGRALRAKQMAAQQCEIETWYQAQLQTIDQHVDVEAGFDQLFRRLGPPPATNRDAD